MSERSHLLMVAYYFPPLGMGGVQRPLKLAKYLPEFGWDVTVITLAQHSYHALDQSLADELPETVIVKHVGVRGPLHWAHARSRRRSDKDRQHRTAPAWARRLQQLARWPDDKFGFVRPAVRAASRLLTERPYDLIWTTSPPPSVHRVGLTIQRTHKLPWVADFRDPWLVNAGDWGPTRLHARYAKQLRARIVEAADAVIVANGAIASGLGSLHPRRPVEVIHNGYDESDFISTAEKLPVRDEFRILFYGTLAPVVDPAPALQLLSQWRARRPDRKLRIVHAGLSIGIDAGALAREHHLDDIYESLGYLRHSDAIAELTIADVVVIPLSTESGYEATVPGRIFEALRSLRPILLVASPDCETARILARVAGTWTVPPDDSASGLAALDAIAALPRRQPARNLQLIAQYERREQARRTSVLMDSLKRQRRESSK